MFTFMIIVAAVTGWYIIGSFVMALGILILDNGSVEGISVEEAFFFPLIWPIILLFAIFEVLRISNIGNTFVGMLRFWIKLFKGIKKVLSYNV